MGRVEDPEKRRERAAERAKSRQVSPRSFAKEAIRDAQRAWLSDVMATTGKPLTKLAEEAGRPGSTLTRFFNSDEYSGILSPTVVQAISEATGIAGPGAILKKPAGTALREDGVWFDGTPYEVNSGLIHAVAIFHEDTNAKAWLIKTNVLEVVGIRPNDVLIIDRSLEPRDGDVVCAQIEHGFSAKTVFRIYKRPVIMAAALDPLTAQPEVVDGSRVQIKGVMIASLRGRRA